MMNYFLQMDRFGNPMCSRLVRAIPGNKPTRVSKIFLCSKSCSVTLNASHNGTIFIDIYIISTMTQATSILYLTMLRDYNSHLILSHLIISLIEILILQVTCLAVHENLNYMVVGFENGSILLFKGDVAKERCVNTTCWSTELSMSPL